MKLEIGQKIRISRYEGKKIKEHFKSEIGTIIAKSSHNITVQFKNFKESFCVADFEQYQIEVRVDKKWVRIKIK